MNPEYRDEVARRILVAIFTTSNKIWDYTEEELEQYRKETNLSLEDWLAFLDRIKDEAADPLGSLTRPGVALPRVSELSYLLFKIRLKNTLRDTLLSRTAKLEQSLKEQSSDLKKKTGLSPETLGRFLRYVIADAIGEAAADLTKLDTPDA